MKVYTITKPPARFDKKALRSMLMLAGLVMGSTNTHAAQDTAAMNVSATVTASCSVSASMLNFGSAVALTSSADVAGNTGSSLEIACTSGTSPKIWSNTTRTLVSVSGSSNFPFNLSQTSGASANDLPTESGSAAAIPGFTSDGQPHVVTIYGKILASNFGTKPAAADYTRAVTLSVNY